MGQAALLKLRCQPTRFARRMVAELGFFPNDRRTLEPSTKCAPAETFPASAGTRTFLTEREVSLVVELETKTRTTLAFFAKDF